MKKIQLALILLMLCTVETAQAVTKAEFAVEKFSADTDGWIADALRTSFIRGLLLQGTAIESIGNLPSDEAERLKALKAKGYKYLVRGKALSTINSTEKTKAWSSEAKAMVEKTVYNCEIYYAISFVNCETGKVSYSTVDYSSAKYKDSEAEAVKDAVAIRYPQTLLPEEYRLSLGKIVSLGESSKKGAKSVFATITHGTPYKGRIYTVYEQIPSEEWGFDKGDMFLSKIGKLKLKDTEQDSETIEIKVTDGEKEIKEVFDAGIHQMIIK